MCPLLVTRMRVCFQGPDQKRCLSPQPLAESIAGELLMTHR